MFMNSGYAFDIYKNKNFLGIQQKYDDFNNKSITWMFEAIIKGRNGIVHTKQIDKEYAY